MTRSLLPRFIIVGGAPASGKTTLAEQLAAELSLPLLTKDLFKEALFDYPGLPADRERSGELSRAAYAALYRVAARAHRRRNQPDPRSQLPPRALGARALAPGRALAGRRHPL